MRGGFFAAGRERSGEVVGRQQGSGYPDFPRIDDIRVSPDERQKIRRGGHGQHRREPRTLVAKNFEPFPLIGIFEIGGRESNGGDADFRAGEQWIVVSHALPDDAGKCDRDFGSGREGMQKGEAESGARNARRSPGEQSFRGGGRDFFQGKRTPGPDEVHVGPFAENAEQIKTQFGRVIPALLGRRRTGEQVAEAGAHEGSRRHVVDSGRLDSVQEREVDVCGADRFHPVPADQVEHPTPVGLADVVVIAQVRFVRVLKERRQVEKKKQPFPSMGFEVALQPCALGSGFGQAGVEDL